MLVAQRGEGDDALPVRIADPQRLGSDDSVSVNRPAHLGRVAVGVAGDDQLRSVQASHVARVDLKDAGSRACRQDYR